MKWLLSAFANFHYWLLAALVKFAISQLQAQIPDNLGII